MNKIVGLVCFLVVLGAAVFAFAPRPVPVFPATAVSASRLLLLGVAAADKRAVVVGERGVIMLSDDDGRNWRLAKSPTEVTLTAVHFVDARRGFAVGHDAVILMTEDAGETWTQVQAAPDEQKPLLAIWFENAERGIAVGAYSSFYRTIDGGKSWQATADFAGDLHFNALAGGADGKVFLVGESGMIVRSDDAGRSWTTLTTPYKGSYFGVLRVAETTWLAFGLRGNVFRSNDDGDRWNPGEPGQRPGERDGRHAAARRRRACSSAARGRCSRAATAATASPRARARTARRSPPC